jgi:hypothetical protein
LEEELRVLPDHQSSIINHQSRRGVHGVGQAADI